MENSTFILQYPSSSGFDKSEINFYTGKPQLTKVFNSEKTNLNSKRLFVTDTTIAALDDVKPFISTFNFDSKISDDGLPKCGSSSEIEGDFLLIIGAGESFKTMDSVLSIVRTALEHNLDRNCTFISIGGGVLCDMTAFAASIFKRGVDVEFVPTTLLSMVDASVGGKTGCDFEGYKNMIGSFYPAKKLHVWPNFVKTLPDNEYISGLSEAIKTALLFNKESVSMFESNVEKVLSRDDEVLFATITECVKAKAHVVQEDFKEKGIRSFLNLGHTFGHALEAVAGLGVITHGEAVAWGMGRALDLSLKLGLAQKDYVDSTKTMLASYGYDMGSYPKVLSSNCAETDSKTIKAEKLAQLVKAMHKDKKNSSSGEVKVILQKNVQDTLIMGVDDTALLSVLED